MNKDSGRTKTSETTEPKTSATTEPAQTPTASDNTFLIDRLAQRTQLRIQEDEADRKENHRAFLEGIIMVVLAVGIGLLGVYIKDEDFHDFAVTGSILLAIFGGLRLVFGRD